MTELTSTLFAEVGFDYVHGAVRDTDDPLPRIHRSGRRQASGISTTRFRSAGTSSLGHSRIGCSNRNTDGGLHAAAVVRGLLGAGRRGAAYDYGAARQCDQRAVPHHLSLIKHLTPEMGRNFKLLYNVKF